MCNISNTAAQHGCEHLRNNAPFFKNTWIPLSHGIRICAAVSASKLNTWWTCDVVHGSLSCACLPLLLLCKHSGLVCLNWRSRFIDSPIKLQTGMHAWNEIAMNSAMSCPSCATNALHKTIFNVMPSLHTSRLAHACSGSQIYHVTTQICNYNDFVVHIIISSINIVKKKAAICMAWRQPQGAHKRCTGCPLPRP